MGKIWIQVSKLIVYIALIFMFIGISDIAKNQDWSSSSVDLTNWGMLWQYIFFCLVGFSNYRLSLRVDSQDKKIKEMYVDMLDARDLRANYTINHSERLNTIEYKIGIR